MDDRDGSSKQDALRQDWRSMRSYGAVGLEMGIAVALGAGAGIWLDRRFGTGHVCTLVGLFFGLAAAAKALWRTVRQAQAEEREQEAQERQPGEAAGTPPSAGGTEPRRLHDRDGLPPTARGDGPPGSKEPD